MVTADPEKPSTNDKAGATRSPRAEALLGSAPDEQIGAAVDAQKWARAADLLALHGERLLLDGMGKELGAWLEALPDEHVARNAKVAALLAWVRIYEQRYQDALKALSKAERALQQLKLGNTPQPESDEVELRPFAELEHSLASIRAHLAAVAAGAGAAHKLPDQVEHIMIPASADHPLWRAASLIVLGRSRLLAGDLRGAEGDLEAAHVLGSSSRGAKAARVAADAAVLLGRLAEARGKLDVARRRYEEVLAGTGEATQAARLGAQVGLARVALVRLELDEARARLRGIGQGQSVEGDGPRPEADPVCVLLEGELARAKVLVLEDAGEEARAALDQLDKALAAQSIRWPIELIGAHRARKALLRKDESQARRWLQQYAMRGDARQAPTTPIAAFEKVTAALVHAALKAPEAALAAGREALAFAEATGNRQLALEALVALALGHHGAGSREDARAALVAALEAAQSMGGALLPLAVRGLEQVAAEAGLESPELARALACLPPVSVAPRAAGDRPVSRPVQAAGPIETAQVAAAPTAGDELPTASSEPVSGEADEDEVSVEAGGGAEATT